MRIENFVIVCMILWISVSVAACSSGGAITQQSPPRASVSPSPQADAATSPSPNSPIRSVDFANFTYPASPMFSGGIKSFTLQQGKYPGTDSYEPVNLAYLTYGDATGDSDEEAIVVLGKSVRGTAIPRTIYVYALRNNEPVFLWSLQTGDRADGGLRQIYTQDGELVVEQYFNPDTITGKCPACPTHIKRAHYEWQGNGFRQKGEKEIIPNPTPESPASPIMPRYVPAS